MKTIFSTLILCLLVFYATAQNPTSARGCVIFKRGLDVPARVDEYRKFENLGTNIAVTDIDGRLLTVLHGERPIFIPYPTDSSATLEKATAQIAIARKTYPELSRRLAAVEKAWAAVPQAKVATVPTAPVSPPPPTASKPSPGAAPKGMEIVTINGTKYENVTITSVEPDGLSISHEAGVAKVLFTNLSAELQAKHGYDKEKAAAYAAQVTQAQHELMQKREDDRQSKEMAVKNAAETKGMYIKVSQVVPGGILADVSMEDYYGGAAPTGILTGKRIFVQGVAGAAEGYYLIVKIYPNGLHTFNDTAGARRTIEKWVLVPGTAKKIDPLPDGPSNRPRSTSLERIGGG